MPKVRLIAFEPVAERLGTRAERRVAFWQEVGEEETLEGLVHRLVAAHPSLGEVTFSPASQALTPAYRMEVNGTTIPTADWPVTTLKEGDRVLFRRRR